MESAIWTEKYRPKKFSEMIGQKEIVSRVGSMVKNSNLPHLIFSGSAGIGKSTLALVIAKEMFGEDIGHNFLELNASVAPDTPLMVKIKNKIKRTNFRELEKIYFKDKNNKRVQVKDLKVLSINPSTHKIKFSKVDYMFRHKVTEIAKIKFEGGHIKTSLNHSVIVLDKHGELKSKKASELKKGDLLISFKTSLEGKPSEIDLSNFKPNLYNKLTSGMVKNPKVKTVLTNLKMDKSLSRVLGLFLAEGCTSFRKGTSGQTIFSFGSKEKALIEESTNFFKSISLPLYFLKGKSGFDRSKESSLQVRVQNTQLAKFFDANFYGDSEIKKASSKRIPSFLYNSDLESRQNFLKGYFEGDGSGEWGKMARISSRSKEALIDTVWLGRVSALETTYFTTESRILWPHSEACNMKSEFLPTEIVHQIIPYVEGNPTYMLRHSLYWKKSKRILKSMVTDVLNKVRVDNQIIRKLKGLVNSDLFVLKITDIKKELYEDYVYDVSVPGSQMFWGGTSPVLLHNSDSRGIDTIRNEVKDFAKTKSLKNVPFKIILLDESDSLTKEAQQALRRTMENYSKTCRFIFSCNFPSKIIDPIVSRCVVFKFKPLKKEEIIALVENIVEKEKLVLKEGVLEALFEVSEGDCRRVMNTLQSCSVLSKEIKAEDIYYVSGTVKPKEVLDVLKIVIAGDFVKARRKLLEVMLEYGLSGLDLVKQIQREIWNLEIRDSEKIRLIERCGEIEFRMVEGSDEFLQVEALLASFVRK